METVVAIAIIALVVIPLAWFALRRSRDKPAPLSAPATNSNDRMTEEQIREVLRSTIKVEMSSAPSRPWYDVEYPMQVVGEQSYQTPLRGIAEAHPGRGRLRDSAECEAQALLIPETNNPHDARAVRVEIQGQKIGYLSRSDAARYRDLLGLAHAPVKALIVGGWHRGSDDRGSYGVRLAFEMMAGAAVSSTSAQLSPVPVPADPVQPAIEPGLLGQIEPRNDAAFPVDVMGEVRYQHVLERVYAGRTQEDGLVLVVPAKCIPDDRGDSEVRVEIGGETIGHLTSAPAWIYTMTMDGATAECRARIYGGTDHGITTNAGHFGVRLDLVLRDLDPEIEPHRQARDYPCEIMGEANSQPELRSIVESRKRSKSAAWVPLVMATLAPDTESPPRVHVAIAGQAIGYLGKVNSRRFCESGGSREVPAYITTSYGADGRIRYGVRLELRFDKSGR